MWRRVEIRNFRSIEHVKVDLAPFTVLVGPNGSGKSNFADALVFARDIGNDASTAIQNRGGISSIRRWQEGSLPDVAIDVRLADTREKLRTDYGRYSFVLGSKPNGAWAFKREQFDHVSAGERRTIFSRSKNGLTGPVIRGTISETTSAIVDYRQVDHPWLQFDLGLVRRLRLNPDVMREPQLATERTELDESGANIAVAIQSLRKRKSAWNFVLLAMKKIIPGLEDISIGTLGRHMGLKFTQRQGRTRIAEFAATEISEGALRALGIIVAAQQLSSSNELLIIEEPEVAIHIGAATLLFDVLKQASRRGAVLLTTHSADLLDAARDEEILVCDYRDGLTQIGPLASAQRKLVKEGLFSVAELMRSEPLRIEGAKPRVITNAETSR